MTNPPPPVAFEVPRRVPCFEVEAFAAAVKPADVPPPRESPSFVRAAEAKAAKIVRAATWQTKQAASRVKAALKEVRILKEPRIKAAIAKRIAPAKPTKVAAKTSKQTAKPAKDLAKTAKEPAKRTKEAALRGSSKPFQP
jgi:hypothetical protein